MVFFENFKTSGLLSLLKLLGVMVIKATQFSSTPPPPKTDMEPEHAPFGKGHISTNHNILGSRIPC